MLFGAFLSNVVCDRFVPSNASSEAYNSFLKVFSEIYGTAFPKKEVEIKIKRLETAQITKGLRKSYKKK